MAYKIITADPWLAPYEKDIALRLTNYQKKRVELLSGEEKGKTLADFAGGYEYFGFHPVEGGYVFREWAPGADALYLTGDFCAWDMTACPMTALEGGVYEVVLTGANAPKVGDYVQVIVKKDGELLRRVPSYATRVVQDDKTYLWCAQIEDTLAPYPWTDGDFQPTKTPLIYECHIGMAQDAYGVGSYREFCEKILPRIKEAGYNTIQVMAIM